MFVYKPRLHTSLLFLPQLSCSTCTPFQLTTRILVKLSKPPWTAGGCNNQQFGGGHGEKGEFCLVVSCFSKPNLTCSFFRRPCLVAMSLGIRQRHVPLAIDSGQWLSRPSSKPARAGHLPLCPISQLAWLFGMGSGRTSRCRSAGLCRCFHCPSPYRRPSAILQHAAHLVLLVAGRHAS